MNHDSSVVFVNDQQWHEALTETLNRSGYTAEQLKEQADRR